MWPDGINTLLPGMAWYLSIPLTWVLTLPWCALEGHREIAWGFSPRTADANHMAP